MPNTSLTQRLEFLSDELGLPHQEVLSKAIEVGICVLYQQRMGEKYLAGELDHGTALRLMGPREVARLECIMREECEEEELDVICGFS